jgi:hypothetical protein
VNAETPATAPELDVRQQDGVLWLTICRESRRNALSPGVLAGLAEALTRARGDRGLRAIVLTGAGDKAFCAGADLQTGQSFKFDYSEPHAEPSRTSFRQCRAVHARAADRPRQRRLHGRRHGPAGRCATWSVSRAARPCSACRRSRSGVFPAQVLSVLGRAWWATRMLAEMCHHRRAHRPRAQALEPAAWSTSVSADLDAGVQALLDAYARQVARRHPPRPLH